LHGFASRSTPEPAQGHHRASAALFRQQGQANTTVRGIAAAPPDHDS
jgi:hypothetical protein